MRACTRSQKKLFAEKSDLISLDEVGSESETGLAFGELAPDELIRAYGPVSLKSGCDSEPKFNVYVRMPYTVRTYGCNIRSVRSRPSQYGRACLWVGG